MTYVRSERTIYPLEPKDRDLFLTRTLQHAPVLMPNGLDARKVVLFLYQTGMHPDVLVHPKLRMLTLKNDGSTIRWHRPKNDKEMVIPVHPDLVPWVVDFVAQLRALAPPCPLGMSKRAGRRHNSVSRDAEGHERVVRDNHPYCFCSGSITRAVKAFCADIDFPGVTPRTIRHTFAARIWKGSKHDSNELKKWIGTESSRIAARYSESKDTSLGEEFSKGLI